MSEKLHTRSDIPVLIAVSVFVAVAWHAVAKVTNPALSLFRRAMQLCVAPSRKTIDTFTPCFGETRFPLHPTDSPCNPKWAPLNDNLINGGSEHLFGESLGSLA